MSENGRKIFNILIAVLVSIGGWTFVVYNNDPMTEVRYSDIPITFIGEDVLANQGYGVSQVSASTVDVTLRQQRVDTANITAEDITVTADVSEATEGENGISLQISGPDGTQVADTDRSSISVEVEEAGNTEKEIFIEYDGSTSGFEPVTTKNSSTIATVIGAKSEIERVDKVAALLSLDQTSDTLKNFTSSVTALDEDGKVIDHLVIYPGEINFNAYTGTLKEVTLKVVTTKELKDAEAAANGNDDADDEDEDKGDGYTRTYSAPKTVVIKGSADAVSSITSITTEPVDIDNMYESQDVSLECVLPEGVYLANGYDDLTMKVYVRQSN